MCTKPQKAGGEMPPSLHEEWVSNIKTWFNKDHLWGGVSFESADGESVTVIVTDYMQLERRIKRHFTSYRGAMMSVGSVLDDCQREKREAYAAWLKDHLD